MPWDIAADVVKGFFTGVLKDMRLIPHTALSALFLWILAWSTYFFVYPQVAQANALIPEVRELRLSMDRLNARLIKEEYERNLRSITTEIYNLEREIQTMQSHGTEVPGSMWNRLNDLRNAKAEQERDLVQFMNSNGTLLERRQ